MSSKVPQVVCFAKPQQVFDEMFGLSSLVESFYLKGSVRNDAAPSLSRRLLSTVY